MLAGVGPVGVRLAAAAASSTAGAALTASLIDARGWGVSVAGGAG